MYSGLVFASLMDAASGRLQDAQERINRINTFPVPDRDSGTNMWFTWSAAAQAAQTDTSTVGLAVRRAARGALLAARGNSGIILSQIIAGFAKRMGNLETFTVRDMAEALAAATEHAYRSMSQPVEGTILTVMRAASEAAQQVCETTTSLHQLLQHVVEAARDALARTPDLLPRLKAAGVVDAGGFGLLTIFEAMRDDLVAGHALSGASQVAERGIAVGRRTPVQAPDVAADARYGYEVQCLALRAEADLAAVRSTLERLGDSVLVVGDAQDAKIHVHTRRPQDVVDFLTSLADLRQLTFENLDAQAARFPTGD